MLPSDFQAKLRRCSNALRIYCGNDDTKPAGIYHVNDPTTPICGVDKNYLPEWPIYDDQSGRILKSGWKRALRVLIEQGYLDRRRTEHIFSAQIIGTRRPEYVGPTPDSINKEIDAAYMRGMHKTGRPAMSKSDLMDIASEINKKC